MAHSLGVPTGNPPKLRNANEDYLKAVNDQIAERESVGVGATPYLLQQKAELEAKLGIHKFEEFEHAAAEPLPETVVPRRPGRPRKNPDSAAGI